MLLAVAGLEASAVAARAATLASRDWSSFEAEERAGFHFARKLSKTPWDVRQADINALTAHLGREHALDSIWYVCWCNYMTRVADAFQIPLEKENVFRPARDREQQKSGAGPGTNLKVNPKEKE